jgi:iron complex outermembrane receptor protein
MLIQTTKQPAMAERPLGSSAATVCLSQARPVRSEPFMPGSTLRKIALAVTALTSILSAPAWAEDAAKKSGAGDDALLSDIIVTARRVDERLQDVPISITVYNTQQLADRNITSTVDLGTYTPSLTINGRYGPDKSSFAIRGFSQDPGTVPTVGVYFADAVAPRLNSNLQSGNGASPGGMNDLQNVQVLKGPQGTLFGRNTTGGAILLVPKRPTDRFEGYVEGTVGNYNAKRIEAVVNVPVSENLKIRLGVDRNHRDGYIHNRTNVGPKDFNDLNYFAARLSILAELTPDLENYLIGTYSRSETNGPLPKIVLCNRGTIPGTVGSTSIVRAAECAELDREVAAGYGYWDGANSAPNPFVKSRQVQAINTTTWKASDTLTVKNIFSYGVSTENYSFNIDGDNIPTPFVIVNPGPNEPTGDYWTLTDELQFQGRTSDDRLTWQAGGYLEHSAPVRGAEQYTSIYSSCTNIYAYQCTPFAIGATTIGSISIAKNRYFYHNYGLYAQASYKLTDQFTLTAGVRNTWDYQREEADNSSVTPSPTGLVRVRCSRAVTPANPTVAIINSGVCGIGRTFSISSHKPTWLVYLEYKPTQALMVYAKYARGYRAGGINESSIGAETANPEKVDDYEVGFKASFDGAIRGTLNVNGYWNNFTDQLSLVSITACTANQPGCTSPGSVAINGLQNIGKSRIRGVEVDGSILLTDDLRFDVGYSYLDAVVIGASLPFCDTRSFNCAQAAFLTAGNQLAYAPKNRLTVTGTYTLPLDESIGRISVGATFTHTDSQYSGHTGDSAFAAGAIPFNASLAPATDLLNLNLNWKGIGGKPVDFALFASNVTNEKYWVSSAGTGLASLGADFVLLGQPRMFGARLKYTFGG